MKRGTALEVVVDEREGAFFGKCAEASVFTRPDKTLRLRKQQLHLGDIVIKRAAAAGDDGGGDGDVLCIVERKTLSDLMMSIKDGRYEEQSFRLLHSSEVPAHNVVYLLEGVAGAHLPKAEDKKKLYSAMTSLLFFKGFSVLRTSTLQESVDIILAMADKLQRDLEKGKEMAFGGGGVKAGGAEAGAGRPEPEAPPREKTRVERTQYVDVVKKCKKDNLTRENFGEIVLAQIPGVSSVTAKAIMASFAHISELIGELNNNPAFLDTFTFEVNGAKKKLNKAAKQKVLSFLLL